MEHFGEHVTYDGYGGDFNALNDSRTVAKTLADMVAALGMRPLTDPEVHYAGSNGKKDPGGWSGFVLIQESHISIHTFPARGFVSADVYTCRNGLDVDAIKRVFRDCFKITDEEVNFVVRGTRYPAQNIFGSSGE